MNIRSVIDGAVSQPPTAVNPRAHHALFAQSVRDRFQPAQNENLVNILQQQPEVRPNAVENARCLATDPSYPGPRIIASLAHLVVGESVPPSPVGKVK